MSEAGTGYVVHEGCDHIFFVGFLGAGKSTLARNLGQMFHRSYLDVDRLVERRSCKSVCDIFAEQGEATFRRLETEALKSLRERKSLLVSCGGGVVESPESCDVMHEMGVVVYLDGDLDDSLRQIQHPELRPDLGTPVEARALLEHRRPLYQRTADFVVDIRGKSFDAVASEAAQLLWEEGLL
jgi:shikimate kinase